MKRFVLFLTAILFLSGCAQVFEGNAFKAVDTPPPLKASDLAAKPVSDIQDLVNKDPSFLTSLRNDPAALAAVQGVLATGFSSTSLAGATTSDTKAAVVSAAQSYVMATAFGTNAGTVANQAIQQAGNLVSGGNPSTAVQNLLAGKSQAEITTLLTQFTQMNTALNAMQTVSTVGTTVNSTTFFGTSTSKGDLAQVALVAAAASALVADNGGTAGLAALSATLATGGSPSTGTNMTSVTNALNGSSVNPATNNYAYLSAVTGIVKI